MADVHLAAAGSNTSPYETWAKAATSLAGAIAGMGVGDRLCIDSAYTESGAGFTSVFPGTETSPNTLISCTHSGASGPTALSYGAALTGTGASPFTWSGSFNCYGINFISSNTSASALVFGAAGTQVYDTCTFNPQAAAAASYILFGNGGSGVGTVVRLINPTFKMVYIGNTIRLNGIGEIVGGSFASGSANLTAIFNPGSLARNCVWRIIGLDLSANIGSAYRMLTAVSSGAVDVEFIGCKQNASWANTLIGATSSILASGVINTGSNIRLTRSDPSSLNYSFAEIQGTAGTLQQEATLVRTGGATDGTTPLAIKMVSASTMTYPANVLRTPLMPFWNTTTGSAQTATVSFLHDSATNLQDDEIWIRVLYLNTAVVSEVTDRVADVITAAADQDADSGSTWTTTGMSNPNKQSVGVAFTAQRAGPVYVQVVLAKPSYTVYVDPLVVIS